MIRYIFEIDKNAAFAYVIQSLINWSWHYSDKGADYYTKLLGGLSEQELAHLNDFGKFLKKKNKGFYFLWKLYSGKKIISPIDYFRWKKTRNKFADKFERLWTIEFPKLESWKQKMEAYDFSALNDVFDRIAVFLGIKTYNNSVSVKVKLLPNSGKNRTYGLTKREFKDTIILGTSNLEHSNINKLIDTLIHETAHLLEYNSTLAERLLKKAYTETILPLNLERGKVSWRYLFIESLISAIAGNRVGNNYVNYKIFREEFRAAIVENQKDEEDIEYKMKAVSFSIAEMTKSYLDSSKVIDKNFCDYLAKEWRKAITDKNYLNNIPYEKISF